MIPNVGQQQTCQPTAFPPLFTLSSSPFSLSLMFFFYQSFCPYAADLTIACSKLLSAHTHETAVNEVLEECALQGSNQYSR